MVSYRTIGGTLEEPSTRYCRNVAVLLTGCGSESGPPAGGPSRSSDATGITQEAPSASASTSSAVDGKAEPTKAARGHLIKTVGLPAGSVLANGKEALRFTVNFITPDPVCTSEYASLPQNGRFLAVQMDVETTAALAEGVNPSFFTSEWGAIRADGMTSNVSTNTSAAFGCLAEAERLPPSFGPGERGTGTVILDVESPSGIITLNAAPNGRASGWEWAY